MRCRPLILASLVAVAAFSLLAAGCGGGGSPRVASVASSASVATTTAQNGTATTMTGTVASALAFARCMRSHGVPNWPDPNSGGFFDKSKLQGLGLTIARARALEQGPCDVPLPSHQQYAITPADQVDYREGAACMRRHGFPDFPDPSFQNGNVELNIPSSTNTSSAQFESAEATCQKLIPAGLPDSGASER